MCERCAITARPIGRRGILKLAAAAAAGLALQRHALAAGAAAPPKPENVLPPDAALDRLMQGNARYVDGISRRHDFKHEREALSRGQNPFAAVLSCADSRIAPEYCFDTARGDVFVCRVAGNFANDDIVASLEYAVQVLSTPLILVLGHEACGAVDAAIKSTKDGTTLPGHLPALVTALGPAVAAAQGMTGDLLDNAIERNVKLNVERLKRAAPILKSFVDGRKLRVVGGVYELKSGRVRLVTDPADATVGQAQH
jgi:carbonic anhydrase